MAETLRVLGLVVFPLVAQGPVLRRSAMVTLAEKLDLDRRAGRLLSGLRSKHGEALVLRLPFRRLAVVLDRRLAAGLLEQSPDPFRLDNREKRAALSQFQPDGVLISPPEQRKSRRPFNEAVLDADRPLHRLGAVTNTVARQEASRMLSELPPDRLLTWDRFVTTWWHVTLRVILGDGARDDHTLVDLLNRLRAGANWSYLLPRRTNLRKRFTDRLTAHLERAEPGSLAAVIASTPASPQVRPHGQVPHWLFADDAAGIAAYRALALLCTHPDALAAARAEADAADPDTPHQLPFLRACLLESLRLWPTALVILRETTTDVQTGGTSLPAGTGVAIVSSFFHRDETALPYADRFAPEIWLSGEGDTTAGLVPFSGGPGHCPGRQLVLHLTSTFMAALLRQHDLRLTDPDRLGPPTALKRTLNQATLHFHVTKR